MQDGLTPLHIAAKAGNAEMVRYLVLAGANVDEYNKVCHDQEESLRWCACVRRPYFAVGL